MCICFELSLFYDWGKQRTATPRTVHLPPPGPACVYAYVQESTVALAGLTALSPAATALSSYQEAADVADRLLVCLDSAVRYYTSG